MAQPIFNLLCNGLNPITVNTTSTSVVYVPYVPGPSIGTTATAPVAGFLSVPGSGRANGQYLSVRGVGNIVEGADTTSPTLTVGLYYTTSTRAAATTASIKSLWTVTTSTAGFGSTTGTPWKFSYDFNCDSTSGILQGNYTYQISGAAINTGVSTIVTGINMSADQPINLCLGFTFSQDGTHSNQFNVTQFDLSM